MSSPYDKNQITPNLRVAAANQRKRENALAELFAQRRRRFEGAMANPSSARPQSTRQEQVSNTESGNRSSSGGNPESAGIPRVTPAPRLASQTGHRFGSVLDFDSSPTPVDSPMTRSGQTLGTGDAVSPTAAAVRDSDDVTGIKTIIQEGSVFNSVIVTDGNYTAGNRMVLEDDEIITSTAETVEGGSYCEVEKMVVRGNASVQVGDVFNGSRVRHVYEDTQTSSTTQFHDPSHTTNNSSSSTSGMATDRASHRPSRPTTIASTGNTLGGRLIPLNYRDQEQSGDQDGDGQRPMFSCAEPFFYYGNARYSGTVGDKVTLPNNVVVIFK